MNADIETAFRRLHSYLVRARLAVEHGDSVQALADTAEIAEIARRLWEQIRKEGSNGDPA